MSVLPSALVLGLAAVVMVACGSSATPDGTSHDDSDDQQAENWSRMEASSEFQSASGRYQVCMAGRGYPSVDSREGIVLKDGTVHKPDVGQSYAVTGAYLEFRLDSEYCSAESGMNDVRAQYETADPTPNPSIIRTYNEYGIQQAQCLEEKGWEMSEPVNLRGKLIWDVQFASDEERQAYVSDKTACNIELFGTPWFPQ